MGRIYWFLMYPMVADNINSAAKEDMGTKKHLN
jgi:hypothetical protein